MFLISLKIMLIYNSFVKIQNINTEPKEIKINLNIFDFTDLLFVFIIINLNMLIII
jgi:hypothetical protein